jgi:hypothetical protein
MYRALRRGADQHMTQLFSPTLLREIRGLPGARHSFVKQLCAS